MYITHSRFPMKTAYTCSSQVGKAIRLGGVFITKQTITWWCQIPFRGAVTHVDEVRADLALQSADMSFESTPIP